LKKFSFSRKLRLTTKADFQAVFDDAKKVNQKYLLALFKKNTKTHPRVGIMISKKNVHDASDRNRIRRIIRESFRHQQEKLKGFDIIVMGRSQCGTIENPKLKEMIQLIWEKIR
jgi:ribonuclease P protein component